jgi:undecaprenyl diphosphate synthase
MDKYLNSQKERNFHVAIIMDGNGRWATRQGKPRFFGHQAGAAQLREIVEAAPEQNIDVLTVYAFSSDNWRRPKYEVNFLMDLFNSYLKSEVAKCQENGIRLSIIGRRDRLQPKMIALIEHAENETATGTNLHLRVAVDYSSKDMIIQAARRLSQEKDISQQTFSSLLSNGMYPWEASPDVDLLIRTGGEKRLSDFLLWECAYAELYFTPVMWPDFNKEHLQEALGKFQLRERRFGQVPQISAV